MSRNPLRAEPRRRASRKAIVIANQHNAAAITTPPRTTATISASPIVHRPHGLGPRQDHADQVKSHRRIHHFPAQPTASLAARSQHGNDAFGPQPRSAFRRRRYSSSSISPRAKRSARTSSALPRAGPFVKLRTSTTARRTMNARKMSHPIPMTHHQPRPMWSRSLGAPREPRRGPRRSSRSRTERGVPRTRAGSTGPVRTAKTCHAQLRSTNAPFTGRSKVVGSFVAVPHRRGYHPHCLQPLGPRPGSEVTPSSHQVLRCAIVLFGPLCWPARPGPLPLPGGVGEVQSR